MRVMPPQRLHICELREGAIAEVASSKTSTPHPEECRRKWGVGILILLDVACRGRSWQRHFARPRGVMRAQGLAVGEAQEPGAIVNFGRQRPSAEILRLGQERKPPAEGNAVGRIVQAQEVRSAVSDRVTGIERCAYRDLPYREAGSRDPHIGLAW